MTRSSAAAGTGSSTASTRRCRNRTRRCRRLTGWLASIGCRSPSASTSCRCPTRSATRSSPSSSRLRTPRSRTPAPSRRCAGMPCRATRWSSPNSPAGGSRSTAGPARCWRRSPGRPRSTCGSRRRSPRFRCAATGSRSPAGTASGHRADAVVVAVPLNALGAIEFDPPLPDDKRAAIALGQASRGVKLMLRARGEPRSSQGAIRARPSVRLPGDRGARGRRDAAADRLRPRRRAL